MPATQTTHWLHHLIDSPQVERLAALLQAEPRSVAQGASGSSTTLIAGALTARLARPCLLVVAHLDDADDAIEDLALFDAAGHPLNPQRFGALEVLPGESAVSIELLAERLAVVQAIREGAAHDAERPLLLVAPIQALMQGVPAADALDHFQLDLKTGGEMPPGQLFDWLDRVGYARTDAIKQPGDFATRGGIIDIFLPSAILDDQTLGGGPAPIRLDFFGDEIDSISLIDTDTMGSGRRIERVRIIGASVDRLQQDERTTSLLSMLPEETFIVMNEVMELSEQARGYYERLTDPRGIFSPQSVFKAITRRPHVEVNAYSTTAPAHQAVTLPIRPLEAFDQDAAKAVPELAAMAGGDESEVVALCANEAERDRLRELLSEHAPDHADDLTLQVGYLHRGFTWQPPDLEDHSDDSPLHRSVAPSLRRSLSVIPHHELFHRYHTRRRLRRVSLSTDKAGDAFIDLEVGDCVVHIDHGIARFRGLRTMRRQGRSEDFLTLEFAGNAMLHVPATQIELIQKYVGGFEGQPPLSKLGGKRWAKQKEAAAEAAKNLASEMLRLQAARAALPGIRYPGDTAWQREFEAEFPYEETDDQLSAIAALKRDMADEQPMDRLICGDVGFGKTEVAIRAAFKAVEYGKQVAVLVPTTVLAEQHERTFRERMADYPFRIESISRFKTGKEQKQLLDELRTGRVDVIIGTHRLLSEDVRFSDLGLVIIDEEQRFGVEHKQKLLKFRMTADVLTLTATPIPRTLHMSMLGLRDISSLSTAPIDRRAIVTEVVPYNGHRIKQAIYRELNRDGQIFFVHNRVYDIQSMADAVQALVPEARIVVGHGQMSARELEKVMLAFIRRDADILVSTTIIESGIDIPTANTMFINNADHFGLADLHQLRGRVGRYKHRAYCYLLLPMDRTLSDTGQRRLKAIEQYSMLGAGFKIAMRDLEIRGAGNLLGAEQSGHIAAVGYQMYCHLLEQEAKRLQHEKVVEPFKTHIELPVTGRLEPQWIKSDRYRMEAYRQFSRVTTLAQLDEVVRNLTDAYGKPPASAQALIDITELRVAASHLGIEAIKLDGPDVIFRITDPQAVNDAMADAPGRVSLIDNRTVYFRPPSNYLEPPTLIAVLRKLLVRPTRRREQAAQTQD